MNKQTKKLSILLAVTTLTACNVTSFSIIDLKAEGFNNLLTQYQQNYVNSEDYTKTNPITGTASWSTPNPIKLSWETEGTNNTDFVVTISKDQIFDETDLKYTTSEHNFDFYNSELGKTYYWQIESGDVVSETSTFVVQSTGPRNLFIEGVENFRDISGWGNIIKQGMLYRSGRLNSDKEVTPVNEITENGIFEMVNHLKIKTEIDLRRTSNNEVGGLTNQSVLGDSVNYIQLPMAYGGNNILTFKGKLSGDQVEYDNPARIKEFFELLADESNYPIHYHCSIGKDRTGCLSYLIEGLLGADEEYLIRDYMFTNFAKIGGICKVEDITKKYGKTLEDYEIGNTTQEKVYNYLLNEVGISSTTLDKVISILKA